MEGSSFSAGGFRAYRERAEGVDADDHMEVDESGRLRPTLVVGDVIGRDGEEDIGNILRDIGVGELRPIATFLDLVGAPTWSSRLPDARARSSVLDENPGYEKGVS
jgi:hypothetical protein